MTAPTTRPLAIELAMRRQGVRVAEQARLRVIMSAVDAGMSLRTIAGHVGLDRRTVAAMVDAETVARSRATRKGNRPSTSKVRPG